MNVLFKLRMGGWIGNVVINLGENKDETVSLLDIAAVGSASRQSHGSN